MARSQKDNLDSEKQISEDYIKSFTFHDDEINKDIEAYYNPKEKDATKAYIRKEIPCGCK